MAQEMKDLKEMKKMVRHARKKKNEIKLDYVASYKKYTSARKDFCQERDNVCYYSEKFAEYLKQVQDSEA